MRFPSRLEVERAPLRCLSEIRRVGKGHVRPYLQAEYARKIADGSKTVEGRPKTGWVKIVKPGDCECSAPARNPAWRAFFRCSLSLSPPITLPSLLSEYADASSPAADGFGGGSSGAATAEEAPTKRQRIEGEGAQPS